jgi:hypothetical protein
VEWKVAKLAETVQLAEEDSLLKEEQRAHATACSLSNEDCGESVSTTLRYATARTMILFLTLSTCARVTVVNLCVCVCCQASCYIPRLRVQRPSSGVRLGMCSLLLWLSAT